MRTNRVSRRSRVLFTAAGLAVAGAVPPLTAQAGSTSSLHRCLLPGGYSAIVTGVNNGTGNALVEFYNQSTNNQ